MNSRDSRAYYRRWLALVLKQEQYFLPKIRAVLQGNNKAFSDYATTYGLKAARDNIGTIIEMQPLHDVLQQLYLVTGTRAGRLTSLSINQQAKSDNVKKIGGTMGYNAQRTTDILNYFRKHALNKSVANITKTQEKAIIDAISKGVERGLGEDEIIRTIENSPYTDSHARLIVRTEVVRASNAAAQMEADRSPFILDKQWISAHDGRTRRPPKSDYDHYDLHLQVVPYDRPFFSGGEEIQYPGDPEGSPGNVINCRCTVAYIPRRDADGFVMRKPRTIAA